MIVSVATALCRRLNRKSNDFLGERRSSHILTRVRISLLVHIGNEKCRDI